MAERLCGYCRAPGHRKPDCPTVAAERNIILTHTPKQRLALIETLARLGFGIGATFRGYSAYEDKHFLGTIQNFDFIANCNFVETTNIKYSKRVKLKPLNIETDYLYRRIYMTYLQMGDGAADYRNLGISISLMLRNINGRKLSADEAILDTFNKQIDLFSPSNEIVYDPEILVKNISMPDRLRLSGESHIHRFTGAMPIEIT